VPTTRTAQRSRQARRVKLARLRAAGIDAFPVGFRRTHTLAEVRRAGRTRWRPARSPATSSGSPAGSCSSGPWAASPSGPCATTAPSSRICCPPGALGADQSRSCSTWTSATGSGSRGRYQDPQGRAVGQGDRVYLLGKALRPLPDKWKGLTDVEVRSRQRELDLAVNPAAMRAMRLRSRVVGSLRESMLAGTSPGGRDPDPQPGPRRRPGPARSSPTTTPSTPTCNSGWPASSTSSGCWSAGWTGCSSWGGCSATRASTRPTTPSSPCSSRTRPSRTTGT
jgi:lysyl-tRNA synthetase class 2